LERDGTLRIEYKGVIYHDVSKFVASATVGSNNLTKILPESAIGTQLNNAPGAEFKIQAGDPQGGAPAGYRPPGF